MENLKPVEVTNARWYPLYHVAAPAGWINDPNGFCVYNGQYHLFYQHYPYSVKWGPMHWGHVISDDLSHWKHLTIALEPTETYELDERGGGCWSGSAIEKDGKLYLMYTGHSALPGKLTETQNLAISDDGINFEKYAGNPVLYVPSGVGDINEEDFRDPKVWKHGGKYYVVVGSKNTAGDRGQVLFFESENLIDWNFKNIMASAEGNEGRMWECPNFAEIDGQEVLIMSPMGIKPEGKKYLNLSQSGYMIGKLDYDTGIFTHGKFDILDYGFDFYAPQITQTADGRCILIGWADMWNFPHLHFDEQVDGWSCQMTVPRELHIKNGKIISVPVKELENLRIGEKSYSNVSISEKTALDGISGETGELLVTIDSSNADGFFINLRNGGAETTVVSYDKASGFLKLNRDKSGGNINGEREVKITGGNKIDLQIFLDRSSIEIFINGGERVITSRVYPKSDSQGIFFTPVNGTVNLEKVTFYKLGEGIPQPVIK